MPEVAASIFEMAFDLSNQPQEHLCMMALGGNREVKGIFDLSCGTATSSIVHPREVFAPAMLAGACTIIVCHNHPSGNLIVSPQDKEVTSALRKAGELLQIRLDDHLIIGLDGAFVSAG